jgi:hypothetical protein
MGHTGIVPPWSRVCLGLLEEVDVVLLPEALMESGDPDLEDDAPEPCQRRFAFDPPTAGMELTHPDGMTASVTNRVSIGVRLHLRSGCGWGAKDPGAFLFP